jgi:neurotrimin
LDIESTPSSVAVRENQNINMTCRADGFPTPKIIWRREDGQSITVERKKKGKVLFILANLSQTNLSFKQ